MKKTNSININFIRFKATDGVELRGWINNESGDRAVIHVHGRAGNGYENYFLDELREMFRKNNFSFFAFDNRGCGVLNSFWTGGEIDRWGEGTKVGGSCYEIFDESELDIQGAIDFLKSLGKKEFILMGHSLGGSKVVNYILKNPSEKIITAILLAPTDMIGWANTDKYNQEYLDKSKKLIAEGKGQDIVGFQCWLDKTPISAQAYPGVSEPNTSVDIYADKSSKFSMGNVQIPMIIAYGDSDIGITEIDKTIEKWLERTEKVINENTQIKIIENASHSFKTYEPKLAEIVEEFIKSLD